MRRAELLLLFMAGCYLSPDTHPVALEIDEAGVAADLDASVALRPTSDATLDATNADAALDMGCASSTSCSATEPLCSVGRCVGCTSHEHCSRFADTPACGSAGACVPCASDSKARCGGATPACDPLVHRCVECVVDGDCPDDQKSTCSPARRCDACMRDADCARFGKVCETTSGRCVQCRPTSEEADCRSDPSCDPKLSDCAGTACDPKLLTCTKHARGSLALCAACVSDSECSADHRCVPLAFGSGTAKTELGGFCMKLATTGCSEPFRAPAIQRASLSGAPAVSYCGINEAQTSCPAIEALKNVQKCSDATSCGAPGARCEPVNFGDKLCTYACDTALQCPVGFPCAGTGAALYCGGPT